MSDNKPVLDFFGQFLMERIRDEAIDDWERIFQGKMRDNESKKIFETLSTFSPEQVQFIANLFPKIVDTTLHHFLWTLEQEEDINVLVKATESKYSNIREISDGLAGELYTEDGWISRFSNK
ncbi:epimerase [Paenibacillus gallinarum]|uniref:Epimerase n=1 Tax=Paenibacillus gallinarum TaxID=2762232 RepID=A0ABR8T3U3_9BACL|nr:epimerase [Paenibacillus gallinarum]MBD7970447.1 epimerase [Paenibacillus gallinarum]